MRFQPRIVALVVATAFIALGAQSPFAGDSHTGHAHPPAEPAGPAVVSGAWSPVPPPGIETHAVYFALENAACLPLVVIGAESPDFATAAVHETATHNGMTAMEHVQRLTVPAGETASFEPLGRHLMLTGPMRAFGEGDSFVVRLHLADGTSVSFDVLVGSSAGGHDHHHHGDSAALPEG